MKRPSPYVPLSVTFATGRTGTAIIDRFGVEGLGVWAAMLAAAGNGNRGQIIFHHEADWAAIGLELNPPSFDLKTFLKFLGRQKQTRSTSHGRVIYVDFTKWERWNKIRTTELAYQRKARSRQQSERDTERDNGVTLASTNRDPEAEAEADKNRKEKSPGRISKTMGSWPGCTHGRCEGLKKCYYE